MKKVFLLIFTSTLIGILLNVVNINFKKKLSNHEEWISHKQTFEEYIKGSSSFSNSRSSLYRNKLNLGKYYGHNEVYLKDYYDFDTISLDYELDHNGYLDLFFLKNIDGRLGIRLSKNPDIRSLFFLEQSDGLFLEKKPLNISFDPPASGSIKIRIDYKKIEIFINDIKFKLDHERNSDYSFFASRGCHSICNIDNVILSKGNNIVFREDFSPYEKPQLNYLYFLYSFLFSLTIVQLLKQKIGTRIIRVSTYTLISVFLIDFFIFSNAYKKDAFDPFSFNQKSIKELKSNYTEETYDLIFIGTSSTRGVGATKKSLSYFEQIKKKLQEHFSLSIANFSVNGSNEFLVDNYLKHWKEYSPKLVVFIVHPEFLDLGEYLKIINSDDDKNRKFIIILRPIPYHLKKDILSRKLEINLKRDLQMLREKSKKRFNNIRVVDLFNSLDNYYSSGHLFWDDIHYSDYGHKIISEKYSDQIISYIKSHNIFNQRL